MVATVPDAVPWQADYGKSEGGVGKLSLSPNMRNAASLAAVFSKV